MQIYLAAKFSRQDEMRTVREQLTNDGHRVTSRWLDEEPYCGPENLIPVYIMRRYATYDLEDIEDADAIVCFTEPARTGPTRGGRHVEFGYALALGKLVYAVGDIENVFYSLPNVQRYKTWAGARRAINDNEAKFLKKWNIGIPEIIFA